MKTTSLLIPLAAFALTATSVHAFSVEVLKRARLSDEQKTALEAAYELKKEGDREKAREVLEAADIDLQTVESLREAVRVYRQEMKTAVHEAIEHEDFAAFKAAAADSPIADIVTTKPAFEELVQAHKLQEEGAYREAQAIFDELGIKKSDRGHVAEL